jgi:hypothetical protein
LKDIPALRREPLRLRHAPSSTMACCNDSLALATVDIARELRVDGGARGGQRFEPHLELLNSLT